jgi:hypothetical protein
MVTTYETGSWDSSVIIVTRLEAGCPGASSVIPNRSKKFISSPKHKDQFWGPPTLLFNGYQGFALV